MSRRFAALASLVALVACGLPGCSRARVVGGGDGGDGGEGGSAPLRVGTSAPLPTARAAPADSESCRAERRLPPRAPRGTWTRPALPRPVAPIRLDELAPTIVGDRARAPRTIAIPARMIGRAARTETDDAVVLVTPSLGEAARAAATITLVVRAPEATRIEVSPVSVAGLRAEDRHQRVVTIPHGTDTTRIVIDLDRVLRGNWHDGAGATASWLDHLLVRVVTSRPRDVRIDSASIGEPPADVAPAAPTTSHRVALGGIVRPSIELAPGARALYAIDVPEGGAALVAHVGSERGRARLRVAVLEDTTRRELVVHAAPSAWARVETSLGAFAGKRVTLAIESFGREPLVVGAPRLVASAGRAARPPDVIVYLVDMLLPTQLGAFGNPRGGSPTIDRVHAEGMAFAHATSPAPWTKPAVPSLFTALLPTTHGVGALSEVDLLPASVPTFVDRFREAGFRTVSVSASPLGSSLSGLDRGFDAAVTPARWDGAIGPMQQPTAVQLHRELLAFIDEAPDAPFFAYVHSLDVHEYKKPMFAAGAPTDRPYDRAIRQQDSALAELLAALRARRREVVLVLVSDHGHVLADDTVHPERGHGTSLYDPQIRIPLVFHAPGLFPSLVVDTQVSLVDVAPTLLELFELSPLEGAEGRSLLSEASGTAARAPSELVSSSREWFVWTPDEPRWFSVRDGRGRAGILVEPDDYRFFDLGADPCQRRPLDRGYADLRVALDTLRRDAQARRRAFVARHDTSTPPPALSTDDVARLRSLGYVR